MRRALISAALGCLFAAPPVFAAPADDVKALLEQGKPKEAYQLGREQPDQLGNPSFDFFYGIAALDGGNAGEGVLALERYLLNFPDNRSARFQLARGYFILGEDQRARDEFDNLLSSAADDEKSAVERFLEAIKTRESRYQPSGSFYLEAGLGVDNNINAGLSGGSTPTIPGIGNLPSLADNAISAKEGSSFTSLAGGAQGTYPLQPGVALYGAVGFDAKLHHKDNDDIFDQLNIGATGGLSLISGRNLYKVGLGLAQLESDNQRYVQTRSLSGEWQHQMDQFNRFNVGLQFANFHYDDMFVYQVKDKSAPMVFSQNSIRSSDFTGISAGWTRAFDAEYGPVLNLAVNYGEEHNKNNRPDLSRDVMGLRVGGSLAPAPHWGLAVGASYQESNYKEAFATFAPDRRKDRYTALDASVSYFYNKNLTFKAEALLAKQQSNIGLYDYDRDMLAFKVRYDFK